MSDNSSELPEGWSRAAVEDIAQTATGGTPSRKREQYYGGTIPWVKSGDLNDGLITGTSESITDQGLRDSNAKIFPRGAVCVALYGATVGKLGILDFDAATNQAVCGIFPEGGIESKFVFYSLRNERENLISQSQGGAQPNISNGIVKKTVLRVPPLAEQRRIVAKIEALQERSRKARKVLAEVGTQLEQFRQSLLAAAFRGDLTADWRAAYSDVEPASDLLKRLRKERRINWEKAELAKYEAKGKHPPKNWQERYESCGELDLTTLPSLPEKWCYARADELVEPGTVITYGIVLPGPALQEGVPYIRGQDIENGQILFDQLLRTSAEIHAKHHRSEVQSGDVLLCVIRHLKVALVPQGVSGVNLTQGTVRLRPSNVIHGSYLSSYLSGPTAQHWMKLHHSGLAMPRINVEDARAVPIPLPPLAEQQQIVNLVSDALARWSSALESTGEVSDYLDKLDQSILSKAFHGELIPQDPNDEPASVLLERIRQQRKSHSAKNDSKPNRRTNRKEA